MKKNIFKHNNIKGCTIEVLTDSEWWRIIENLPASTFFHTPYWFKSWKQYKGYEHQALNFIFSNNRHLFLSFAIDGHNNLFSNPAGTFGGFLTKNKFTEKERSQIASYLQQYNFTLRQNPYNQSQLTDSIVTKKDFTQRIYLPNLKISIVDNWTKGHRSALNKGVKSGIIVREATKQSDWKNYYNIYQKRYQDWGENAGNFYDFSFFSILQTIPDTYCKLWLAEYKDKCISGGIFFYYNQKVIYWHGAGDQNYFNLNPYQVLQYEVIKNAFKNGYQWYDLNPSGGYLGVEKFKKGFGSVKSDAHIVETTTTSKKIKSKLRSIYSKIRTR